jgi:hypothetical protein
VHKSRGAGFAGAPCRQEAPASGVHPYNPGRSSFLNEVGGMLIHTFAFRWKAGVTEGDKDKAMVAIRDLQGQIPGLLNTWVGKNISPRSQGYELGGVMQFVDRASLDSYGDHPVHQALLEWLMPLIEPIEVDFEA